MTGAFRTVILVHGLWFGQFGLTLLRRRLVRPGFDCHGFSYPTLRRSLANNAWALFEFARRFEGEPLDFVGHSLGGLVILRMLDEFGGLPPGRVVLLGSPVKGSKVASQAADLKFVRPLVGRARSALEYGFNAAPADRETGVIIGTSQIGVGRLLRRFEQPGDGVVSVDECRLEGAADELVLPVTHTGLVTSKQVAEAVACFLETGRFQARS